MNNTPEVKLGIIAVSRDCFPMTLSEIRRKAVVKAYRKKGGIGIFAIPQMGRFYRHVLIEKNYPHHGAVVFGHYGKALFEVLKSRCNGNWI